MKILPGWGVVVVVVGGVVVGLGVVVVVVGRCVVGGGLVTICCGMVHSWLQKLPPSQQDWQSRPNERLPIAGGGAFCALMAVHS